MSNVFSRYHKKTGVEYWDNLVEIEIMLTRFLMNDKNIPKSYRFVYTFPILQMLGRMWFYIEIVYRTYPNTPELLEKKKKAIDTALNFMETVISRLQMAVFTVCIDVNKMDTLGDLMEKESAMLRNVHKNCKLQKGEQGGDTKQG